MFQSLTIKIVIGVILGWLKSLWDRFLLVTKSKEEGRQEVRNEVIKANTDREVALEKLRNTDTTFDAAARRLRDRSVPNE